MPKHVYFSSDIIYNTSFEAIDVEKGIIKGVKVCSEGEAKGHGVHLNKKFIREVTRLGKEHTPGIKARFGHPNMCATSLGTYIGRYKNYRTNIEQTKEGTRHHSVADLYLDETSKNLPKLGNAWEYIMNLAQSSPDMFGNSIVFTPGISEFETIEDEKGNKSTIEYATIEQLHATDLVDDPAATDGLFSKYTEEDMAAQVTLFLDQHPEIYDLAINYPDLVQTFLNKYESYKNKKNMTENDVKSFGEKLDTLLDKVGKLFSSKESKEKTDPPEKTDIELANEKITALESEIANLKTANETEKTALETEKASIEALKQSLSTKETEAKNLLTELQSLKNDWKPEVRSHGTGSVEGSIDKDGIRELRKKANSKNQK